MTLDKPEDKEILLELINKAAFPGSAAEKVVELKKAIAEASIQKNSPKK